MIRTFGTPEFLFMLSAARWTVLLSLVAYAGGGVLGLVLAAMRTGGARPLRWFAAGWIGLFQCVPLLMLLFLVFFGLALYGRNQNPYVAVTVALSLYAGAYFGEIWRGAIEAVPRGQTEAAMALGLHYSSRMRDIVLPQAIRISLPATIGYLVQLIKGTSLAAIVGFIELARAGQIVSNQTFQPLLVFGVVGAMYFILCWPLSWWGSRMEARLALASQR